jgi:nucleoside triphosphate diphosphatase
LKELMNVLRKECPWDAEQTLDSLRTYTLEEVHEVFEAIEQAVEYDRWQPLKAELGDLLLQVLFYACIASERNQFNLDDVAQALIDKMVYRHPHVFATTSSENLGRQWESLKDAEHVERESLMDGIPPLPALAMAHKIQRRAARVGFDWAEANDVMAKMHEEVGELEREVRDHAAHVRLQDEFGDVLFTLVNLGRKLGIDAELALLHTNRKFASRFRRMEGLAEKRGLCLDDMPLNDQESLYNEAKGLLAGQ